MKTAQKWIQQTLQTLPKLSSLAIPGCALHLWLAPRLGILALALPPPLPPLSLAPSLVSCGHREEPAGPTPSRGRRHQRRRLKARADREGLQGAPAVAEEAGGAGG
jgi:hypothetical protein